jgi:type IV fimbrial biogenesis protein FimT/type IV fimbrial biogenesis protein FimU
MMVVVALLAIFAGVALPSFRSMIESSRVQNGATTLFQLLQAARTDAVSTRTALTLCPTSANLQWTLVRATSCGAQSSDIVSRQLDLPSSLSVNSSVSSLTFKPDGTAANASVGVTSSGTSKAFSVTVEPSGFISLSGGAGQ